MERPTTAVRQFRPIAVRVHPMKKCLLMGGTAWKSLLAAQSLHQLQFVWSLVGALAHLKVDRQIVKLETSRLGLAQDGLATVHLLDSYTVLQKL